MRAVYSETSLRPYNIPLALIHAPLYDFFSHMFILRYTISPLVTVYTLMFVCFITFKHSRA